MDAFKKAHADILETMLDDVEKRAKEIALEMTNNLFSVVQKDAVITYDERTRQISIGGVIADPARVANLKAEAEFFVQSDLWKLIHETPKALAERAMFVSGETLDDMRKGRAMLFTLATQTKVINTIRSYQQSPSSKT